MPNTKEDEAYSPSPQKENIANRAMATVTNNAQADEKPLILALAGAAVGHFLPALQICQHLVQKGYHVSILQASYFADQITGIGAAFIPLDAECDFCQFDIALKGSPNGRFPERLNLAPGLETLAFDLEHVFMPYIPSQARSILRAIATVQAQAQALGRKVVILAENSMLGIVALRLASDENRAKIPPVLGLNVVPLTWESVDTGPFGTGLPPDSTPSGRARNKMLHSLVRNFALKGALAAMRRYLVEAGADPAHVPGPGCSDEQALYFGFNIVYHPRVFDKVYQMCLPAVEFPRSDLPAHIQFAGGLPRKPVPPDFPFPAWWAADVLANAALPPTQRKKLVVVAQGTFANDYRDMILPTIRGLGARPDAFLTVALLGKRGAVLSPLLAEGEVLPSNARVADYLPYDAVLPYADVFVQPGSYGGFQHGIVNAVPQVLGGVTEDKPEIGVRAEWSGVGIDLHTGRPTPEQILKGVDEVLADPKYKSRCVELSKLMAEADPLGTVENELLALAKVA